MSNEFPRYPRIPGMGDANLREVAPGLWVGGHRARQIAWAAVVDLIGIHGDPMVPTLSVPMQDGQPFARGALDAITDFVGEHHRSGPILIHCRAGFSRSVSAAYAVCRRMGLGHAESIRRVKSRDAEPAGETFRSARQWADSRGYP